MYGINAACNNTQKYAEIPYQKPQAKTRRRNLKKERQMPKFTLFSRKVKLKNETGS